MNPSKSINHATSEKLQNIFSHLTELRKALIYMSICISVVFISLLPFSKQLYTVFSTPLIAQMPINSQMIATDITTIFLAPFKLSLFLAFLISLPFLLYCLWKFIRPALYKLEKSLIQYLLITSLFLFYIGISFAYFIVLPSILYFFMHAAPEVIQPMTDINSYLSFCLKLFFIFGLCFEIPIIIITLIIGNIVDRKTMIEKRKFIIVFCFFIAMLITPPDIFSMLFLAIPMWFLFEIGLYSAQYIELKKLN